MSSEFNEFLKEIFECLGTIHLKKMFGGFGVYYDGVMFGLVVHDTLYLKADETLANEFAAKGLSPFIYYKGNKAIKIAYFQAPEDIYDDREEAEKWARRSFEVALYAKNNARKSSKVSS